MVLHMVIHLQWSPLVDVDASTAEMAHLNSLTEGMTFIKEDTLLDEAANRDAEFNLAHLPSDAVVARGMGAASETEEGASGLELKRLTLLGQLELLETIKTT